MNFDLEKANILFDTAEGYLANMTNEQMMDLFRDYYVNQLKNSEIVEKYFDGESGRTSFKTFFPLVQSEEVCPNCGELLVYEMPSKTARLKVFNPEKMFCLNCEHREGPGVRCHCEYCEEMREIIEKEEREQELQLQAEKAERKRKRQEDVLKYVKSSRELNPPTLLSDLTVAQRLMLTSFLMIGTNHSIKGIRLGEQVGYDLGPVTKMTDYIYHQLKKQGLIVYSLNTPIETFNEDFTMCYPYAAHYDLNVTLEGYSDQDLYKELVGLNNVEVSNVDDFYDELQKWWLDIAAAECLECLEYQVELLGWKLRCGEKTFKTIYTLLEEYSISEVFYFIYRAVANASKYVLEKNISKTQAANMVIYHLASDHEYYESRGWVPSKYRRIKELPQSAVSYVFSNIFTDLLSDEFDCCPSIELLKRKVKVKCKEENVEENVEDIDDLVDIEEDELENNEM